MKIAHSIYIRVFCGKEENENKIANGLKWLLPFDIEKELISVQRQTALGFRDGKITILEATLVKDKHVNAFLDNLLQKLAEQQKLLLLRQLESRIDSEGNFFIRFEKEILVKHRELLVTDSGNCYHVRIKVASFPSTKKAAMAVMDRVLAESSNK